MLAVILRLRCDEACEDGGAVGEDRTEIEESDPIENVGEKGRGGGGVEGMDFKVGSKGEADGEEGKRVSVIGKVKARGVGEKMATVGVSGSSVVTSSAGDGADGAGECLLAGGGCAEGPKDLLRDAVSRVRRAGMIVLVMWVSKNRKWVARGRLPRGRIIGRRAPGASGERWLRGPEEENNCARGGQRGKTIRRGLYKLRAR